MQTKDYAKQQNKSLSKMIADYFQTLTRHSNESVTPPITKSLIGILNGDNIGKEDYKKYLEGKYL